MPPSNKVMVITGGPGTGKTTIINAILKIFGRLGVDILLAAPTGRAAKRMTEATGHEARTIHRTAGVQSPKARLSEKRGTASQMRPVDHWMKPP